MNSRFPFLAPLATLLLLLPASNDLWAHGQDPHARIASRNGWRSNLESAKREAAKVNKPLMVVLRCFD